MKDDVVRARIEPQLKGQAVAVLQGCGLELSDAIRLFLRQVVQHGGVPFAIRDASARRVSGKQLWAMKRKAQQRDREAAASCELAAEDVLLVRPSRIADMKVQWPDVSLRDEQLRAPR